MLKVKLTRKQLQDAAIYHAENNEGLAPVIESDEDLIDWSNKLFEYHTSEEQMPLYRFNGTTVIIEGNKEIIEVVKFHIL